MSDRGARLSMLRRTGVRARTSDDVYDTVEPVGDQLGLTRLLDLTVLLWMLGVVRGGE